MADTAVETITMELGDHRDVATGDGTAIVHANTHVITPSGRLEDGHLVIQNTFNGAKEVTILAGDNPPGSAAGQGTLVVEVADGDASFEVVEVYGLESSRFLQDNGTLRVTVAANMTGFMYWVQHPRV